MLTWLECDDASPQRDIAAAYLGRRLRISGNELREELLAGTEDHLAQARILRFTNDPVTAIPRLAQLDSEVTRHFWREFRYFGLGSNFPLVAEVAAALLEVDRPAAALDMIRIYNPESGNVEIAEIVANSLERLARGGLNDPELARLDMHVFERLFALLAQYRDHIGVLRITLLEWNFFPALGFDTDAPTLHPVLAENPEFFVELMTLRCPKSDPQNDTKTSEVDQRHAIRVGREVFLARSDVALARLPTAG